MSPLCKDRHGGTCTQPVSPPDYLCPIAGHNRGQVWLHGRPAQTLQRWGRRPQAAPPEYAREAVRVGAQGERSAAQYLCQIWERDPAVHIFADRSIPGTRANADYVVVKGDRLLVLDVKTWTPGWYWTPPGSGLVRRGWRIWEAGAVRERDRWRPSRTLDMACDRLECWLDQPVACQGVLLLVPPRGARSRQRAHLAHLGGHPLLVQGTGRARRYLQRWARQAPAQDRPELLRQLLALER